MIPLVEMLPDCELCISLIKTGTHMVEGVSSSLKTPNGGTKMMRL